MKSDSRRNWFKTAGGFVHVVADLQSAITPFRGARHVPPGSGGVADSAIECQRKIGSCLRLQSPRLWWPVGGGYGCLGPSLVMKNVIETDGELRFVLPGATGKMQLGKFRTPACSSCSMKEDTGVKSVAKPVRRYGGVRDITPGTPPRHAFSI